MNTTAIHAQILMMFLVFFLEGTHINGVTAPSGPTIVENIATIPGTNVPIAVNTINGDFHQTPEGQLNA